jgi:hypothetical protein
VIALLASGAFGLNANLLAIDRPYDVGTADRAKTLGVTVLALERAAIVPIVTNAPELEVVQDRVLYVGFLFP